MDRGRLAAPLDEGLCCHDSVPERARLVALDGVLVVDSDISEGFVAGSAEGVVIFDCLEDPNPLNSGTSGGEAWVVLLIGVEEDAEGLARLGVRTLPAALAVNAAAVGVAAFCGLIDLARSENPRDDIQRMFLIPNNPELKSSLATHLLFVRPDHADSAQFPPRGPCISRCPPSRASRTIRAQF